MRSWWRGDESGAVDAGEADTVESTVRPEDLDFSDDRRYVVATADSETPSVPADGTVTAGSDGDANALREAGDGDDDPRQSKSQLIF